MDTEKEPLGLPGKNIYEIIEFFSKQDPRLEKYLKRKAEIEKRFREIDEEYKTVDFSTKNARRSSLSKERGKLIYERSDMDHKSRSWWRARRIRNNIRIQAEALIEQAIDEGRPDPIEMHAEKIFLPSLHVGIGIMQSRHYGSGSGIPLRDAQYIQVCGRLLWVPLKTHSFHDEAALNKQYTKFENMAASSSTFTLGKTDPLIKPAYEAGFLITNIQTGEEKRIRGGVEKFDEFAKTVQEFTGCDQKKCDEGYANYWKSEYKRRFFPDQDDTLFSRTVKFGFRRYVNLANLYYKCRG